MNRPSLIEIGISVTVVIATFALGLMIGNNSQTAVIDDQTPMAIKTESPIPLGPIQYNCELSGGTFKDGHCICSIEDFQTQEMMYDKSTGFCQSTHGGPAGDAFFASMGLPYRNYSYWTGIVLDVCTDSGGNISGAACICSSDKTYNETSGKCE